MFDIKGMKMTGEVFRQVILISCLFYVSLGNNLMPKVLENDLKLIIAKHWLNFRPWIIFVEKYIETTIFPKKTLHSNYIDILRKGSQRKQFNSKYMACRNGSQGLQLGIYGSICGFSKFGKLFKLPDRCKNEKMDYSQFFCYGILKSKLTLIGMIKLILFK